MYLHPAFTSIVSTAVLVAATFPVSAPAQTLSAVAVKNVVLVHGAWAEGSSWAKVIPLLEAKGLHVVAVQNPLTSLADDVAATKRIIDAQDGPVLLVGHSYGGAVITEAGNNPKVAGLVYVAAFAPDAGESALSQGKQFDATPGGGEIRPIEDGRLRPQRSSHDGTNAKQARAWLEGIRDHIDPGNPYLHWAIAVLAGLAGDMEANQASIKKLEAFGPAFTGKLQGTSFDPTVPGSQAGTMGEALLGLGLSLGYLDAAKWRKTLKSQTRSCTDALLYRAVRAASREGRCQTEKTN